MLGNGSAVAIVLLLASTGQVESDPNPLEILLKQLEQLMSPRAWTVLFLGFVVIVFLLTVGDQLAGILSWLGVPSPLQREQASTDQLELTRQKLLKIVKKEVDRRLATSLHNLVKLDLYMEDQRQRVGNPKLELVPEDPPKDNEPSFQAVNRVLHPKGNRSPLDLKLTQKIIEVFERPDIQGKLLILGDPGSGKTTELLQLAQHLVTRVEEDNQHSVPVILELSSWDGESLDKWVVSQLKKLYTISEATTQQWLAGDQILLMLDGLDELGLTKQKHCIEKINQFLETTRTSEIIVCCRREEYEASEIELDSLNGAVYLESLKDDQIRQYFEKLNRLSLWDNICVTPTLLELAQKPLFLFMLVVAYQGNSIRNEQDLFDAYVEKQLHDANHQGTYKPGKEPTPQRTRHYLVWLAEQLESIHETEFLIEGLQPSWLPSAKHRRLYQLIYRLLYGLLGGLFFGLFFGLRFGLGTGVGFGLLGSLAGWLNFTLRELVIEPIEKLQWSFREGLPGGLFLGLLVSLFLSLFYGLLEGLLGGLLCGLFCWFIEGLNGVSVIAKENPNQGIRKSVQYALLLGLIHGIGFGLLFGLGFGLIYGLSFGLDFGLSAGLLFGLGTVLSGGLGSSFLDMMRGRPIFGRTGGLDTAIKHFILRLLLTKNGDTPWNYARFLDHAVKHRFIQRTGGRYRFVHDLLRKHFAVMPLE